MTILLNVIGIVVLLGGLYFFSSNKKLIDKKMIIKALVIQFILAFMLVKFPLGRLFIEKVSDIRLRKRRAFFYVWFFSR